MGSDKREEGGVNVGQIVLLIGTDGYMPPVGSVGEIVEPLDEQGDYAVLFDECPCPVPPGPWWYIPAMWLIPLDDEAQSNFLAASIGSGE